MKPQFEQNYFEETYDGDYSIRNPNVKLNSYIHLIRHFKKNGRLIDIGCAYGLFLEKAYPYFDCEGIDISKHAIKIAKKRLPALVRVSSIPLEKLGKRNNYDVITCFDVLEHIKNLSSAVTNLHEKLKHKGILVFVVPVYDGLLGTLVGAVDKDPTHLHKESRYFWLDLIKRHNFTILYQEGMVRVPLFNRWYFFTHARWLFSLSPAIFVIAQK